jgi:hypothetical protein
MEFKNTHQKGNLALGSAIAYFTKHQYVVSVPLNDCQKYDLIVDNGSLARVQVKYAGQRNPKNGLFIAKLNTSGANSNRYWNNEFDSSQIEILYVLTGNMEEYVIDLRIETLTAKTAICFGPKWSHCKVQVP